MITEEMKEKVMPYVEKLSDQIGDEPELIFSDFERAFNGYINVGMEEERAMKTAVNSVRASYSKLIKLGAKMYDGFFLAGTEKKDRNDFVRKEATKIIETFETENGSLWKPKAIAAKMINEAGDLLITQQIIDDFYNGNPKLSWMLGRKIEVDEQKMAWAFIRDYGTDDGLRRVNVFINEPDEFAPMFGKMYKFRAVVKISGTGNENMTMYKTISALKPSETEISFGEIEDCIGIFEDNIKTFTESYDDDLQMGMLPESPAPKFCISEVIIGGITDTGYGKKKIEVTEQIGDFGDEPIELEIPDEYAEGLYDGALGIMIYRPYYKNNKVDGEIIGKVRAGAILGFISDSKFAPMFDTEISDVYQEEYN